MLVAARTEALFVQNNVVPKTARHAAVVHVAARVQSISPAFGVVLDHRPRSQLEGGSLYAPEMVQLELCRVRSLGADESGQWPSSIEDTAAAAIRPGSTRE